jgi:hypothetical protein
MPRRRISVMKHRSHSLHFCPVHASARASSLCQSALASGSSASSARSPVEYRLPGQVVKLFSTQIIVSAFHVTNRKPAVRGFVAGGGITKQCPLEKRNVFIKKLLLQILRAGRDDYAFAGTNHRHQVGQSLSGARAGFHNKVPLLFQRLLHRLRHLQLPAPEFIRRMLGREHSSRREKLV